MWIASLSNGETVSEADPVKDNYSPWQSLIRRLKNENLEISQMRLQIRGVTIVGIPKAQGYVQCNRIDKSVFSGNEVRYQGIGSVINGTVFMTWLNDSLTVKQEAVPLSELLVHSTLQ